MMSLEKKTLVLKLFDVHSRLTRKEVRAPFADVNSPPLNLHTKFARPLERAIKMVNAASHRNLTCRYYLIAGCSCLHFETPTRRTLLR